MQKKRGSIVVCTGVVALVLAALLLLPTVMAFGWGDFWNAITGRATTDASSPLYTSGGSVRTFDGSSSVISASDIAPTRGVTAAGWFKTTALTTGSNEITGSWISKRDAFILSAEKDRSVSFYVFLDSYWQVVSASAGSVALNTWEYWAGSYDGATLALYKNGQLVASQPASGSLGTSGTLCIGQDCGIPNRYFQGSAAYVQVWGDGLSASAVKSVYDSQTASVTGASAGTAVATTPGTSTTTTTAACTDSDSGKDTSVKGTVTCGARTYTDTCYSTATVQEYYYDAPIEDYNSVYLNCPSGETCSNGACVASTTTPGGVVADAGIGIWLVSGEDFLGLKTASVVLEKDGKTYSSVLRQGTSASVALYEFSGLVAGTYTLKMSAEGYKSRSDTIKVTAGDDGNVPGFSDILRYTLFKASASTTAAACTDSDGGYIYSKGTASNATQTSTDICAFYTNLGSINENVSCFGKNCYVNEKQCADDRRDINDTLIQCSAGCYDGACIKEKATCPVINLAHATVTFSKETSVTIGSTEYRFHINHINSAFVKLTFSYGPYYEGIPSLKVGDSYKLIDGMIITVTDISYIGDVNTANQERASIQFSQERCGESNVSTTSAACPSTFRFGTGASDYVTVTATLKDGEITIPILYGRNNQFIGNGKSSSDKLYDPKGIPGFPAGPFNYSNGDRTLIVSNTKTRESYYLQFTNFVNDNGVNKTTIQKFASPGWVDACLDRRAGDTCAIGSASIVIQSISQHPDRAVFIVEGNSDTIFGGLDDVQGYSFGVPTFSSPQKEMSLHVLKHGDFNFNLAYQAYWDADGNARIKCVSGCESCPISGAGRPTPQPGVREVPVEAEHPYIITKDIGVFKYERKEDVNLDAKGDVSEIEGLFNAKLIGGAKGIYTVKHAQFEGQAEVSVWEFNRAISGKEFHEAIIKAVDEKEYDLDYESVTNLGEGKDFVGEFGAQILILERNRDKRDAQEISVLWISKNKLVIVSFEDLRATSEAQALKLLEAYLRKHPSTLFVSQELIDIVEGRGKRLLCENSCAFEKKCVPFGTRAAGQYCSLQGVMTRQRTGTAACENNYECSSNVCAAGQCVEESVWQRMLDFFNRLFGGGGGGAGRGGQSTAQGGGGGAGGALLGGSGSAGGGGGAGRGEQSTAQGGGGGGASGKAVACVDSDGGKDPGVRGTVTCGTKKYTDECANSNTAVKEYFYDAPIEDYNVVIIACENGCKRGECV